MRHYRPDVSHRMRRRPSLFTAPWFRVIFGGGIVVILALLLGPPVTGWLRGGQGAPAARSARSVPPVPARSPDVSPSPPAMAAAVPPPSAPAAEAPPARAPAPVPAPVNDARKPSPSDAAAAPKPATATNRPATAPTPAGAGVFRIQMGAFLDHRNADRLTERLRGEGLEVNTSFMEESRTTYRVLASPPDGEGRQALVQRLRDLGFAAELTGDGAAVTQPVPLRAAVETSRRLKEQGIRVRLEREASSAAFRVVRVGAYPTAEEAERVRAELAAKGYDGIVIRDR
jgi:cell division protein FtsN